MILTVITVTRNDIDGLRRTFDSLAKQTQHDVEHLIIDGASTDGSAEWARTNAVMRATTVVSEPDRGIYDAMNKGLRLASGDSVCFLNSGDCFAEPDVIETVTQSFREQRWDWGFGMAEVVDRNYVPVRSPQKVGYSWWRQTYWHYTISHQAIFMRTDFVNELGGFDEAYSVAADYLLVMLAGRRTTPVVWPQVMSLMLEGGVSDRNFGAVHLQCHRARVQALRLRGPLRWLDLLWTWLLIAKTRTRKLLRTMQRRAHERLPPRRDLRRIHE